VNLSRLISKSFLGLMAVSFFALPVSMPVANAQSTTTGKTGLPIPRFVSLKSGKANMRVGPGGKYQVAWLYQKKGLPIEIIQEFDNWRKVRDAEGNEGWMLHSLLSGKRTAPGVIAEVDYCGEKFCHLTIGQSDGYVSKANVWGVYPDELIEE